MDKLEQRYLDIVKKFKGGVYQKYTKPKQLKELGNLLMYRRMKKELEGQDLEKLAEKLLDELDDYLIDLLIL